MIENTSICICRNIRTCMRYLRGTFCSGRFPMVARQLSAVSVNYSTSRRQDGSSGQVLHRRYPYRREPCKMLQITFELCPFSGRSIHSNLKPNKLDFKC